MNREKVAISFCLFDGEQQTVSSLSMFSIIDMNSIGAEAPYRSLMLKHDEHVVHICAYMYIKSSGFSFAVVMFCRVSVNTELINTELSLLGEIRVSLPQTCGHHTFVIQNAICVIKVHLLSPL